MGWLVELNGCRVLKDDWLEKPRVFPTEQAARSWAQLSFPDGTKKYPGALTGKSPTRWAIIKETDNADGNLPE